jgi:hypothetical protein
MSFRSATSSGDLQLLPTALPGQQSLGALPLLAIRSITSPPRNITRNIARVLFPSLNMEVKGPMTTSEPHQ